MYRAIGVAKKELWLDSKTRETAWADPAFKATCTSTHSATMLAVRRRDTIKLAIALHAVVRGGAVRGDRTVRVSRIPPVLSERRDQRPRSSGVQVSSDFCDREGEEELNRQHDDPLEEEEEELDSEERDAQVLDTMLSVRGGGLDISRPAPSLQGYITRYPCTSHLRTPTAGPYPPAVPHHSKSCDPHLSPYCPSVVPHHQEPDPHPPSPP